MKRAATIFAIVLQISVASFAAANAPLTSPIEIYWQSSREIRIAGATDVIVLEPEIARAELQGDIARFEGMKLGETVALVMANGEQHPMIVRVVARPVVLPAASNTPNFQRGAGTVANDVQISRLAGNTDVVLRNSFDWTHDSGPNRLHITGNIADYAQRGMHKFDLRGGSIDYLTTRLDVTAIDFNQDLTGNLTGPGASLDYLLSNSVTLRGLRVAFRRGRNTWTVFGGTTIPFYFLTLRDTRDVGGTAFHRQQSETLAFFGASTAIRAPDRPGGAPAGSFMQSGGVRYEPNRQLTFDAILGVSNRGSMGRGYAGYSGKEWSAFASLLRTSRAFPLNQLQSLFADTQSLRAGAVFGANRRVSENVVYEHNVTDSGILSIGHAVSDYISVGLGARLTPRETGNFVYTYSRNRGGFSDSTTRASRYAFGLSSTFGRAVNNSAQLQIGSVADPLGLQAQDEFVFNDTLSIPTRSGTLFLGYSHNRVNPSLVQKLSQELDVLSAELQQLFLENPAGFVASELPPEIRALLESQVPVSDSVTLTIERHFGPRFSVGPNFTLSRFVTGPERGWSHFLGYGLTYRLTPSTSFRSSLSSVWATNRLRTGLQRSTIVTAGIQKSFDGFPPPFQGLDRSHVIEGFVFRDENLNGVFDARERGIAGVEVQLDGAIAVMTDGDGRYRFADVAGGLHRVSIHPAQFSTVIRMTTLAEQLLDVSGRRRAAADFGLVDFARLTGSVFNDLRFDGRRQPDSVPIGGVHLLLVQQARVVKTIVIPANGRFEVTDLVPGDYEVSLDAETLPPDYVAPVDRIVAHVAAASTASIDFALRAMRSISGHVYVKSNGKLVPLPGVQVTVDHHTAPTDADGAFVLRDLPAGNLTVTLLPMKPLPASIDVPSGPIRMPAEPIHVEGATIVISNQDLVPYLTMAPPPVSVTGTSNR